MAGLVKSSDKQVMAEAREKLKEGYKTPLRVPSPKPEAKKAEAQEAAPEEAKTEAPKKPGRPKAE